MFKIAKRALTIAALMAAASAPSSAYAGPFVRPNADEQLLTTQVIPTVSGPTGSPAVRPNADERTATDATTRAGPGSEVIDNGGYGPAVAQPAVVRLARPNGGFDWGDGASALQPPSDWRCSESRAHSRSPSAGHAARAGRQG